MDVGIFCITLGLFVMIVGCWQLRLAMSSIDWPVTTGLITRVKKVNRSSDSRRITHYKVKYTYEVGSIQFESGRYSFNGTFPEYVPHLGSQINVFYNPRKADTSVFMKGYGVNNFMIIGVSFLIF